MKKTINVTKLLRLDELIQHIYENEEANRVFMDTESSFAVHTDSYGAVQLEALKTTHGSRCISKNVMFDVEVEEEIKPKTKLQKIVILYQAMMDDEIKAGIRNDVSVNEIIREYEWSKIFKIYGLIDEKLELIWERDAE